MYCYLTCMLIQAQSRKAYVDRQGTSRSQGLAIPPIPPEKILAHFKHFNPFSY